MNIAIYSRKSCITDKGESTKNQIDMCKQYIHTHICPMQKCELTIYKDEGFSAKNTERPQFQKMVSDAEDGIFSHIVCYKLDRISRNVGDFSKLIEKFNRLDISFICIKEQFDTSLPMGRAMMYMASVFAQLERETIAERVKDNMLMLSKSGRWLGGTPPLGFDSYKFFNDKTKKHEFYLAINENDIKTVKKIYSKFLENYSLSKTKKYLDSIGLKSRLKNCFSIPAIKKILTNPIYCKADKYALNYFKELGSKVYYDTNKHNKLFGIITYNKRNYCKNHGAKNPMSSWVVSVGNHQGIINGKNWVKINDFLCSNKNTKVFNSYSLLSGKLICTKCNSKMLAKLRNTTGNYDYICSNKIYNGAKKCSCRNLNGKNTDLIIIKELLSKNIKNTNIFRKLAENSKHKNINLSKKFDIDSIGDSIPYSIKKSFVEKLVESVHWDGTELKINFKNCNK